MSLGIKKFCDLNQEFWHGLNDKYTREEIYIKVINKSFLLLEVTEKKKLQL